MRPRGVEESIPVRFRYEWADDFVEVVFNDDAVGDIDEPWPDVTLAFSALQPGRPARLMLTDAFFARTDAWHSRLNTLIGTTAWSAARALAASGWGGEEILSIPVDEAHDVRALWSLHHERLRALDESVTDDVLPRTSLLERVEGTIAHVVADVRLMLPSASERPLPLFLGNDAPHDASFEVTGRFTGAAGTDICDRAAVAREFSARIDPETGTARLFLRRVERDRIVRLKVSNALPGVESEEMVDDDGILTAVVLCDPKAEELKLRFEVVEFTK